MKLTYTKAYLIEESKKIPLLGYPAELLTAEQLKRRNEMVAELKRKFAVYKDEKRRAKMRKPSEFKTLADEVNEKRRKQNEKVLARSIKENIKYLEDAVEHAAARGLYKTMSDNLCDLRYREGSSYTQDGMEELLRDALIAHFEPLGFRWEGKGCNYLTLMWG